MSFIQTIKHSFAVGLGGGLGASIGWNLGGALAKGVRRLLFWIAAAVGLHLSSDMVSQHVVELAKSTKQVATQQANSHQSTRMQSKADKK